jgi:hypothetical protein
LFKNDNVSIAKVKLMEMKGKRQLESHKRGKTDLHTYKSKGKIVSHIFLHCN